MAAQQFTLAYPGLEVLSIKPETPDMEADNFGQFPQQHLLTHAWNATVQNQQTRFTLRFRALAAGRLSKILQISDGITAAAAYTGLKEGMQKQLQLQFDRDLIADAFVLHQNQPNPFTENTAIDFYLPQPDYVSLSILDETGKIHYRSEGYYEKGNHTVTVPGAGLPAGVLVCQINGVTKKMIKL